MHSLLYEYENSDQVNIVNLNVMRADSKSLLRIARNSIHLTHDACKQYASTSLCRLCCMVTEIFPFTVKLQWTQVTDGFKPHRTESKKLYTLCSPFHSVLSLRPATRYQVDLTGRAVPVRST
ncbi:hypothetical protein M8J77_025465 [Diaphorina citri]|nr:hypothetical protein M8J77_025465 [Diaphorina citri]